jgi:L-histidine N-alpha-methyltransferase
VLAVINRELNADFDVDAFHHVARWNPAEERMEMSLRCNRPQRVHIAALNMTVDFEAGEQVLTEVSCKFREARVADELAQAGLRLTQWWTDSASDFGLSLSVK